MKKSKSVFGVLIALILLLNVSGLAFGKEVPSYYRLGPGDVVRIAVLGYSVLNDTVTVDEDGYIPFQLVGTVKAAGLNAAELENELINGLSAYLEEPKVKVAVVSAIQEKAVIRQEREKVPVKKPSYVEEFSPGKIPDVYLHLLETGDVLSISVKNYPDLGTRVVIDLVGNIAYPYLGELHVAGLTEQEAAEHIAGELSRHIDEPEVSVARMVQRLAPEDVLQISVWGYPDYSRQTAISHAGYISFLPLGEIEAAGLTRHELATKLSQKLSQYVPDPRVNVKVVEYKDKKGGEPFPYLLDVGDKVRVVLWKPDMPEEHIREVDPSGNLSFPLIGEVKSKGLSEDQLAERLKERWSKYLIDPKVTADIIDYQSRFVYVFGEVRTPGKYPMKGNVITLRDTLIAAGLPIQGMASMRNVRVIRPGYSEGNIRLADTVKLLREGELREDLELQPGDMVYVPPTFLTRMNRFFSLILLPLNPLTQLTSIFNITK